MSILLGIFYFFVYFYSDWPDTADELDLSFAVRCGFVDDVVKSTIKAKRSLYQRGKKDTAKAAARRAPETFQVCAHGQMTFSPSVSLIFFHLSQKFD